MNYRFEELLDKFENGRTRMETDPVFNNVVNALYRSADPIELLDQVMLMREKTQKELTEVIKQGGVSMTYPRPKS